RLQTDALIAATSGVPAAGRDHDARQPAQFLALAERQGATVPLMVGHCLMSNSLMCTGDIAEGRAHINRAIALYDPTEHRPLATRFGHNVRVAIFSVDRARRPLAPNLLQTHG